jgi:hypothetical protein
VVTDYLHRLSTTFDSILEQCHKVMELNTVDRSLVVVLCVLQLYMAQSGKDREPQRPSVKSRWSLLFMNAVFCVWCELIMMLIFFFVARGLMARVPHNSERLVCCIKNNYIPYLKFESTRSYAVMPLGTVRHPLRRSRRMS